MISAAIFNYRKNFLRAVVQYRCVSKLISGDEAPVITTNVFGPREKVLKKSSISVEKLSKFDLRQPFSSNQSIEVPDKSKKYQVQISTLNSHLRVASHDVPGELCSLIIIVGSGSNHESTGTYGSTSLLEYMAFKSTHNHTAAEVSDRLDSIGAVTQVVSTREHIMYAIDVDRRYIEPALEILRDAVLFSNVDDQGIYSDALLSMKEHQDRVMTMDAFAKDEMMAAAFQLEPTTSSNSYVKTGSTYPLGNRLIVPMSQFVHLPKPKALKEFRSRRFIPSNMVLSGAGVDHEELMQVASRVFASTPSSLSVELPSVTKSIYSGGMSAMTRKNELEPFLHLSVGFQIGGWNSKDLFVGCLLQSIMGGGSSFSAGGPGKGMHTRLYRDVMNQFGWIEACNGIIELNIDSGIIGIAGACEPSDASPLARLFCDQIARFAVSDVTAIELNRGKNMLKSRMMMQLESRLAMAEDIARQLIVYGKYTTAEEIGKEIDGISQADIRQLASRAIHTMPSLGWAGEELQDIPEYKEVLSWFGLGSK